MGKNNNSNIIVHTKASEIKMQPINWLWKDRFARGKISIIAGDPGLGKSQIISSMAASITTGMNWHDGTSCPQGKVIILSAEDGNADTLAPRLHAAGANLELIHIIDAIKRNANKETERQFNLSNDINALENLLNEVQNVVAIFIDPITGYLGNIDDHKNSQVRAVFLGVSKLAEKYNIAIICISHNNKNETSKALLRVIGSVAYVATARAVFAVIEDDSTKDKRLLLPVKNNIGNDKTGFSFTIEKCFVARTIETSRIAWTNETITKTADEVLRFQQKPLKQTPRGQSKSLLLELLTANPRPVNEIKEIIEDAGYTFRTIERAKDELGILSKKDGDNGEWRWHLPINITTA